jgi:hypothetical protein
VRSKQRNQIAIRPLNTIVDVDCHEWAANQKRQTVMIVTLRCQRPGFRPADFPLLPITLIIGCNSSTGAVLYGRLDPDEPSCYSARSAVEIQVTSQILSKGHSPGSVGTAASLATSRARSQAVVASNHLPAKVQSYNTACIRGSAASTRPMRLCARKCRLDR